jgi:penicillin G amidase
MKVVALSLGLSGSIVVARGIANARLRKRVEIALGVSGPVTISRSKLGVPKIVASTREDVMFGLGYAMASDRLWQMDLIRRKAQGRLAEIAGPAEVESDRIMRVVGLARSARRSVELCTGESCCNLDALAAGVNHFIEQHPTPKAFLLAGYRPEPWSSADSVSVMLMMGWSLGGSMYRADLLAERCRSVIGDQWTDAIFDGRSAEAPPSINTRRAWSETTVRVPSVAPIFPETGFSNSWAVAGDRSWTGAPILAFDPHLEYTNPSIWYEAMLEAPGYQVAGMTLPGLPGIGSGRSLHLAWGQTAAMISQSLVYREELDESGVSVRDGDEWVALESRQEIIGVKGAEPVTVTIRRTPRGPLISDHEPDLCDGAVSLHWTGMEDTTEPDLLTLFNGATSIQDGIRFRQAASVPCYNASVADSSGNIAQIVIGKIPIRAPRAGLLDPANFPPRYIPADDMPLEINPDRGWVAGANTRLVDDNYPYPMFGVWEQPFRMRRIRDVLESREKHSLADMRALQMDRHSLHAAEMTPVILAILDGYAPGWVLDDLASWDFQTGPGSRATALFQSFYTMWMKLSLQHRFPAEFVSSDLLSSGAASIPRDFCDHLLLGHYPAWFDGNDDVRKALVRVAMDDGLQWLRQTLGDDESVWNWGAVNTVTFQHPLGSVPGPQARWVNPGPFPSGGDRTTIWPAAWRSADGYEIAGGPSMRLVMDMRRPELTWGTNTLGQNGAPWKGHYRDQLQDFMQGRLHRVWSDGSERPEVIIRPPAGAGPPG